MQIYQECKTSKHEKSYPCDLCGSTNKIKIWSKKEREKLDILASVVIRDEENNILNGDIVICMNCGLVYTDEKVTEEYLDKFYEKEYREIYNKDFDINRHIASEDAHARTAFSIIDKLIDKQRLATQSEGKLRFLDVGASTGRMITIMQQVFKDHVYCVGIEPSKEYSDIGQDINKKNNLEPILYSKSIKHFKDVKKFDFITCLNTLEHMHSPSKTLQEIHSILSDDGLLIISVPNILNMSSAIGVDAWFSCAHLYHFAPFTLTLMLAKNGFKPAFFHNVDEEVGGKMYVVAEKAKEEIKIDLDGIPNYALMRRMLLIHDEATALKYGLQNGEYYNKKGE